MKTIKVGTIINDYLLEKQRSRSGGVKKFYPSSIGFCSRRIVYSMLGYPSPEIEARVLAVFENGHSFHHRIETLLEKAGVLIAPELSILDEELNISGRTDAVIKNPNKDAYKETHNVILKDTEGNVVYEGPNNEVALVELKSINNKGFNRVRSQGPKEEHNQQLQLYMYLSGIKQGVLFYENKDTQDTEEFWIDYNEKIVKEIVEKIRTVNEHVANETFPEREGTRSSYKCNYCDYKEICWSDKLIIPNLDDII